MLKSVSFLFVVLLSFAGIQNPVATQDYAPIATLEKLVKEASFIGLGRVAAVHEDVDGSYEYSVVTVSFIRADVLKGVYRPSLKYQSEGHFSSRNRHVGDFVLLFLSPPNNASGVFALVGVDRGEFLISGDPKGNKATAENSDHNRFLWTDNDRLWDVASRRQVRKELLNMFPAYTTPQLPLTDFTGILNAGDSKKPEGPLPLPLLVASARSILSTASPSR
jgi:hypothetical protein